MLDRGWRSSAPRIGHGLSVALEIGMRVSTEYVFMVAMMVTLWKASRICESDSYQWHLRRHGASASARFLEADGMGGSYRTTRSFRVHQRTKPFFDLITCLLDPETTIVPLPRDHDLEAFVSNSGVNPNPSHLTPQ